MVDEANFKLRFGKRDDGVGVWSAVCGACSEHLVGELTTGVPVLKAVDKYGPPLRPMEFEQLKQAAARGWERARASGTPIVIDGHTMDVVTCPDHSMQSALEAHAAACLERSK